MIISDGSIDILLYIALTEEFNQLSDELIEELGEGFVPQELHDIAITVFCGNITSPILKRDFRLAVAPAGKMGITRAAAVTSAILAKSHACDVVVLGIAGSLSRDLQPGDVFIPDSVDEYLANSATKAHADTWTFETSGNHLPTSPRLLNRFQMFRLTQKWFHDRWSEDCAARFAPLLDRDILKLMTKAGLDLRSEVRLYAGDDKKLASGPAVGKGKAFVKWIKGEVDRKVVAMEMESAGVYDASQIRTPAPRVLAIRGISDYADERKDLLEDTAKGEFRAVAVKNAFSLLLRGIEAGLFRGDTLPTNGLILPYRTSLPQIRGLLETLDGLLEMIRHYQPINPTIMEYLNSTQTLFMNTNGLEMLHIRMNEIIYYLDRYNLLPRIPGTSDIINSYLSSTKLNEMIIEMINLLETHQWL